MGRGLVCRLEGQATCGQVAEEQAWLEGLAGWGLAGWPGWVAGEEWAQVWLVVEDQGV